MADKQPTSLFQLPDGRLIETFAVQLPNGQIVMRTREELEALPPELRGEIVAPPEGK